MKYKSKKGFTLAELLIVVAIIAVLVAISIPIFSGQLEKARRAVDMQNARNIESALMCAFSDGSIQIPAGSQGYNQGYGVWIMLCRGSAYLPKQYSSTVKNGTLFCGKNPGIILNGQVDNSDWLTYNNAIEGYLTAAGLNVDNLKVTSKGGKDGWDWIVIEVGYSKAGLTSRIYSGFKDKEAGTDQNSKGTTNIEKQTGRS